MIITDISKRYDTTVKVERSVIVGKSATNTPQTKLQSVIDLLPCMTQSEEDKLIMPVAGQTAIEYRVLFCDLFDANGKTNDIRLKDVVTVLTAPADVNVGSKYLVIGVGGYSTPGLEHIEVNLQGGV